MKKTKLLLLFLSVFFTGTLTAHAGEYSESGYITEVGANIQGKTCSIMLSTRVGGNDLQGGRWSCDSAIGQNLLDVARTASVLGLKVTIVFIGDGATYKPVLSMKIINH